MSHSSNRVRLPLFPLNTVLFPGGPLPLRIFETRYLDMVRDCLKNNTGFGVCLIQDGREVGEAAQIVDLGVVAKIIDWHQRYDGLLGITARGQERFQVIDKTVQPNQLIIADIEILPEAEPVEMPDRFKHLADIARKLLTQVGQHYDEKDSGLNSAGWVSYRLVELLPMQMSLKQYFLELEDPIKRLQLLDETLKGTQVV